MPTYPDIAKLLLRVTLSALLLAHGIHKLIHGIGGVESLVVSAGMPAFVAYGVYVGELIAPLFILLGLYGRIASAVVAFNMLMAIYLAYGLHFSFTKYGALSFETPLLFLMMALTIVLIGSGRYGVNAK